MKFHLAPIVGRASATVMIVACCLAADVSQATYTVLFESGNTDVISASGPNSPRIKISSVDHGGTYHKDDILWWHVANQIPARRADINALREKNAQENAARSKKISALRDLIADYEKQLTTPDLSEQQKEYLRQRIALREKDIAEIEGETAEANAATDEAVGAIRDKYQQELADAEEKIKQAQSETNLTLVQYLDDLTPVEFFYAMDDFDTDRREPLSLKATCRIYRKDKPEPAMIVPVYGNYSRDLKEACHDIGLARYYSTYFDKAEIGPVDKTDPEVKYLIIARQEDGGPVWEAAGRNFYFYPASQKHLWQKVADLGPDAVVIEVRSFDLPD